MSGTRARLLSDSLLLRCAHRCELGRRTVELEMPANLPLLEAPLLCFGHCDHPPPSALMSSTVEVSR
jgi:hypothetical protein